VPHYFVVASWLLSIGRGCSGVCVGWGLGFGISFLKCNQSPGGRGRAQRTAGRDKVGMAPMLMNEAISVSMRCFWNLSK